MMTIPEPPEEPIGVPPFPPPPPPVFKVPALEIG
jgi:hypothetical protein